MYVYTLKLNFLQYYFVCVRSLFKINLHSRGFQNYFISFINNYLKEYK